MLLINLFVKKFVLRENNMKTIKEIEAAYPELFKNCYCGNSCPDGWANILEGVCSVMDYCRLGHGGYRTLKKEFQTKERIAEPLSPVFEIDIAQVKEKFASIRIYYDIRLIREDDPVFERLDYNEYVKDMVRFCGEIDGAISMAEFMSRRICEVTGQIGRVCVNGGNWYKTLCPEKMLEMEFHPYVRK
jgi:hypothetical protein